MAAGDDGGKRSPYGPRQLGALLPAITRPAFRKRAPAGAQLLADWASLVGPALAQNTEPRRLSGDTLTIACSGALAMELQHLAPQLIDRINSQLGRVVVARLRFVQAVLSSGPALPRPHPMAEQKARQAVNGLQPGPLRDALESLGRHVLAQTRVNS